MKMKCQGYYKKYIPTTKPPQRKNGKNISRNSTKGMAAEPDIQPTNAKKA
jgi:hypothetical protein